MPTQTHFIPTILSHGKRTQAYWAVKPVRKLVVFVHGFGGSAVSTWKDFDDLIPKHSECAGWDIIFYGYDGLYTQANISAQELHDFIELMGTAPASVINPTLSNTHQRESSFSYTSILFVAHSLGAVVVRRALLNARQVNRSWLNRTSMILFAPAHMGADVIALGSEAINVIPYAGALFTAAAKFTFQPLRDLQSGSKTLQLLYSETQQALKSGDAMYLVSRAVYFGKNEKFVDTNPFCGDPPCDIIHGKSHMDVCKPNSKYFIPMQCVLK